MQKPATLVLLSGGLDSATLIWYLKSKGRHVEALFVDRAQGNFELESEAAEKACSFRPSDQILLHRTTVRQWWEGMSGQVEMIQVPRNALFAVLALPLALGRGLKRIALGSNATDQSGDSNPKALPIMNRVLQLTQSSVTFEAPFHEVNFSKKDVAIWAKSNLGSDFIDLTFSCWKPQNGIACKNCSACRSRAEALTGL